MILQIVCNLFNWLLQELFLNGTCHLQFHANISYLKNFYLNHMIDSSIMHKDSIWYYVSKEISVSVTVQGSQQQKSKRIWVACVCVLAKVTLCMKVILCLYLFST